MKTGRKRKFNPNIPKHIDQSKIPSGCYWDNSGRGHWYISRKTESGRQYRQKIANVKAKLSDLHLAVEQTQGIERDKLRWIIDKYFDSSAFTETSASTQLSYKKCCHVLDHLPTKIKISLLDVPLKTWDRYLVQNMVDKIALAHGPTTAKHTRGFLRRVFNWGINRGHYKGTNPAAGAMEMPKERKKQTLPTQTAYDKLLSHAQRVATHGHKTKGSCAYYIPLLMELAYLPRTRGIEIRKMTDAQILPEGLRINRAKGSRDNICEINPRLQDVLSSAQAARDEIWSKRNTPIPMRAEDRHIVLNTIGEPLGEHALRSAWQRFIVAAIESGVIDESERFSLHDLKRMGITDTPGNTADKLDASGHKDERMLDIYDKSVKIVQPSSD